MDALIVYPKNKQQLNALKAVIKAMKIAFEQKQELYPSQVLDSIKKSLDQIKNDESFEYKGIEEMLS